MQVRKLLLAGVVLALAPLAATAAPNGKFSATLGFGALDSDGNAQIQTPAMPPMSHLEYESDDTVFSGSLAWHPSDRWAVELWSTQGAGNSIDIDIENGHDVHVAGYDVQPIALTAHYRFAPIHDRFTPFVGLGWHRTRVSGVSANPAIDTASGLQVNGDSGLAAVAGVDISLGERWFVRGDVRYLDWNLHTFTHAQPRVTTSGANSLFYGASIGVRF